jgi:hypothetical protein
MIAGVTNDLEWVVILTDLKNIADCLSELQKSCGHARGHCPRGRFTIGEVSEEGLVANGR